MHRKLSAEGHQFFRERGAGFGGGQVGVTLGDALVIDVVLFRRHADFGAFEAGGAQGGVGQVQGGVALEG